MIRFIHYDALVVELLRIVHDNRPPREETNSSGHFLIPSESVSGYLIPCSSTQLFFHSRQQKGGPAGGIIRSGMHRSAGSGGDLPHRYQISVIASRSVTAADDEGISL